MCLYEREKNRKLSVCVTWWISEFRTKAGCGPQRQSHQKKKQQFCGGSSWGSCLQTSFEMSFLTSRIIKQKLCSETEQNVFASLYCSCTASTVVTVCCYTHKRSATLSICTPRMWSMSISSRGTSLDLSQVCWSGAVRELMSSECTLGSAGDLGDWMCLRSMRLTTLVHPKGQNMTTCQFHQTLHVFTAINVYYNSNKIVFVSLFVTFI